MIVMSYLIEIRAVGDGLGGMQSQAGNAQSIRLFASSNNPNFIGSQPGLAGASGVPGGNAPTSGNFTTALTNLSTDISAQLTANSNAILTRIQNWTPAVNTPVSG